MRLATYNVEWFSNLFDDNGVLINDGSWSSRYDVTKAQQTEALGQIFATMDADAIMVIEAPDTSPNRDGVRALENFAQYFGLRQNRAVSGFANHTQQEISLLYDPQKLTAAHDPRGDTATTPRFDGVFRLDLDIDAREDEVTWSKPPLELAVTLTDGTALRMIGVHAKSKAPHGASSQEDAIRISIENRRKQLAQCIWLRRRIDTHLDQGDSLIVLGDFNDGPGLDEYEKLFGQSGVEIALGHDLPFARQLYDPHALAALSQRIGAPYSTSRFYISHEKRYLNALLDYVMTSPDLTAQEPRWHIWHPFDDPACFGTPDLRQALLLASDHFPVTVDFST